MAHLTRSDLINLFSESVPDRKAGRARAHLAECGECASRYGRLAHLLEPPGVLRTLPRPHVRERVLASAREILHEVSSPGHPRVFSRGRVLALSGAACAVIVAGFFLFGGPGKRAETGISLAQSRGEVTFARGGAGPGGTLREGTVLHAAADGAAMLRYGDSLSLIVGGEGDIEITRAVKARDGADHFKFRITRGSVVAISRDVAGKPVVELETPHARVTPIGTEFMLSVAERETAVVLMNGSLRVRNSASGDETMVREGTRLRIAARTESGPVGEEDARMFREAVCVFGCEEDRVAEKAGSAVRESAHAPGTRETSAARGFDDGGAVMRGREEAPRPDAANLEDGVREEMRGTRDARDEMRRVRAGERAPRGR